MSSELIPARDLPTGLRRTTLALKLWLLHQFEGAEMTPAVRLQMSVRGAKFMNEAYPSSGPFTVEIAINDETGLVTMVVDRPKVNPGIPGRSGAN